MHSCSMEAFMGCFFYIYRGFCYFDYVFLFSPSFIAGDVIHIADNRGKACVYVVHASCKTQT